MQVAQTLRKASSDTNARARSQSNIIKHHRKYGAFGQSAQGFVKQMIKKVDDRDTYLKRGI